MGTLADLEPVPGGYAAMPVAEAFTWGEADEALVGDWYLVAFRSIRRLDADEALLCEYDERAHLEAAASPGFVHYFKGPTQPDGSCLSFCLWTSQAEARAAAARPAHRDAVGLLNQMYAAYNLEFLRVQKSTAKAPLQFEPYSAGAIMEPSVPPLTLAPRPSPS
ncbi:MAG: hypothetical protein ACJ761_06095 [Chloroflexota bacterium]